MRSVRVDMRCERQGEKAKVACKDFSTKKSHRDEEIGVQQVSGGRDKVRNTCEVWGASRKSAVGVQRWRERLMIYMLQL